MSIYKLAANITGGNGIASLDIRLEGELYSVSILIRPTAMDALNDYAHIEISFGSVATIGVNDVLNSIFSHTCAQQFLTTGGGVGGLVAISPVLRVKVNVGERIYMHGASVAAAGVAEAYLYVDDETDLKPRTRRR